MKHSLYILAIIFLFQATVHSQTVIHKNKAELVDDFLAALTDTLSLTHQIIKVSTYDKPGSIYLYFVNNRTYDTLKTNRKEDLIFGHNSIIVYSLITYDTATFYRVTVDTLLFGNNGDDDPYITTVFFANCDKDQEKEMLITFSTFYNRHNMAGYVYKTFAYNFPTFDNLSWTKDEHISSLFDDNDIGSIDNDSLDPNIKIKPHIVKYNIAANIKRKLKELGY